MSRDTAGFTSRPTTHWLLLPDGRWGCPVPDQPDWWELPTPGRYVHWERARVLDSGGDRAARAFGMRMAAQYRAPSAATPTPQRPHRPHRPRTLPGDTHPHLGEILQAVLGITDRPHPLWDQMIRERRRRARAERRCGTVADINWLAE